jgi:hypothetical protein
VAAFLHPYGHERLIAWHCLLKPVVTTMGYLRRALKAAKSHSPNTAAARMPEALDLSASDRVSDQVYNRILWLLLKGNAPQPAVRNSAPLHALQAR